MAPPDREDTPRDTSVLEDAGITESSRLRHNAERLASWLEFLLHPEEHEYDRTVIYDDGTKREEPGPVTKANPLPGHYEPVELDFESVIAGYQPWQFLHGMAAVSTQQVERGDSPLSQGAAALNNIWWIGDEGVPSLVDEFPTIGWTGDAADAAFSFLLRLQTVAGQVNKLVSELYAVVPKYAVIIKGARDNLDEAAAGLVAAFEKKFAAKPPSGFSVDIAAAVLSGIAAAAVTYLTAGAGALVVQGAVASTWSALFTDAVGDVLKMSTAGDSVGGYWWRDLVHSYLHVQAQILTSAKDEVDQLNGTISGLISRFGGDAEIQKFLEDFGS